MPVPSSHPEWTDDAKYSIGAQPVLQTLQRLFLSNASLNKTSIDTVLINTSTVVRNCGSKQTVSTMKAHDRQMGHTSAEPGIQCYKEARQELLNLVEDVTRILDDCNDISNPCVIFYNGLYQNIIPSAYWRGFRESEMDQKLANSRIMMDMGTKTTTTQKRRVTVIELPCLGKLLPYQELSIILKKVINNHNVLLWSHHTLDFHIKEFANSFRLVNSFTGDLIEERDLSEKVFQNKHVPFNRISHVLLGDRHDLRGSLSYTDQRSLKELATKERWDLKTEYWMQQQITKKNIVLPYTI